MGSIPTPPFMSDTITQLQQQLDVALAELEELGVRWLEARAGGHTYTCKELHEKSREVERETRKLERKIHKQEKRLRNA